MVRQIVGDYSTFCDDRTWGDFMIHANHQDMCKFRSREAHGYDLLNDRLQVYIEEALKWKENLRGEC